MRFDDIVGNQDIKTYLESVIKSDKVSHSYLFVGEEGIGKKLIAEEFARKLLCEKDGEDNCDCKSCRLFEENSSPDYMIIDESANYIKIDTIRELMKKVVEKPIFSKRKVYIINDFEKATKEAQNCLLKTLEEPPEFITMILVASSENDILATIRSRCTKISFTPISNDEIKKYAINHASIDLSKELLYYCSGSIGKVSNVVENRELYQKASEILTNIDQMTINDFLNSGKPLYDKEKIKDILEYMIVYFYSHSNEKDTYLDCIEYVNEAIKRIKVNTNLEMSIDSMLLKIWEAFNEKSNRR